MAEEVILEVVDEVYRLVKEVAVLAAVHQYGFGAKHLGYFC